MTDSSIALNARTNTAAAVSAVTATRPMHWTTRIAVAGVMLMFAVEAALIVTGCICTFPGAIGVAATVVAVALLLIVFVGLPHLAAHISRRDFLCVGLLALALIAAMFLEVETGHRGIDVLLQPLRAQAEAERLVAQRALDTERHAVERQIGHVQARIDAAAGTNPGVTYTARMEQWRQNFESITADDRQLLAGLRARLNGIPLPVRASDPYPAWATYAVAAMFSYFSIFGLTMFGVTVPGPDAMPSSGQSERHNDVEQKHVASRALQPDHDAQLQPGRPSSQRIVKAVATELSRQWPDGASKRRDGTEQHSVATRRPPLNEAQVREAIAALVTAGEVISLRSVAAFHDAPKSRADRSPAKQLILEQGALRRANGGRGR